MEKSSRVVLLIVIFLTAAWIGNLLVAKKAQPATLPQSTPTPSYAPIVKSEGDVTVIVKPLVLAVGQNPSFEVTMDTHNVILDFNIASVAKLTDALGKAYGTPVWKGTQPGGHHQKGILTFPQPLTKLSEKVELTFRDIDGIPVRTFIAQPR